MSRRSNEEQKLDAEDRREMEAAIGFLVQNPQFRLFIRRFLTDFGVMDNNGLGPNTYTGNALQSAHEAGKLATIQAMVAYLSKVQWDFYPLVLKEHINAAAARTARLQSYSDSDDYGDD